jgi:DNA-binding beta-propeller fold protein YncE
MTMPAAPSRRLSRRRALLALPAAALAACATRPAPADLDPHGRRLDPPPPPPPAAAPTMALPDPAPATWPPPVKVALLWTADGGADRFARPTGLALGPGGEVYVADADRDRVVVLDRAGRVARAWGGPGGDAGQFRFRRRDVCPDADPNQCEADLGGALAVATDGVVYVADYGNSRVQAVDGAGQPLAVWGGEGDGPGQLRQPRGIAVDAAGRVCVSDSENHRVQVFDQAGRPLAAWGRKGAAADAFFRPGALAADRRGVLYVADLWNARIGRRDAEGRPLPEWPAAADLMLAAVAVSRPSGLALDGDGRVYLAGGGPYVQQFDAYGQPRLRWRDDWQGRVRLQQPAGVAVDGEGDIYVADAGGHGVVKFRVLTPVDR